jgi:hypothetical protein
MNKHSLRSNTKVSVGKTNYTDSQNSDTTAPSGRQLYHLQFSLQAASPESFGYALSGVPVILFKSVRVRKVQRAEKGVACTDLFCA